ncbi:tRNA lysidine(34) synthetase TilS [Terrarubrum flagellatum]|uniref:tRNA lysidine(34) synthetase TilS n=1 Tax=Terrirubrum flagellatum TaxID=2895980 RepID=UPI003145697C
MRGVSGRVKETAGAAPIGDEEAANLFSLWNSATGVLIAVSGGPDSIALLGLAARWRAGGAQTPLLAATFDHGLRAESAREARMVSEFAESHGVTHHTLKWVGEKPTTRIQELAREARYDALARHALFNERSHLAVAHHQGDQAETVLLRMAAGTGVAGLAGMSKVSWRSGVTIHRPFLDLPKPRLIATCRAYGWLFIEDPSNEDDRFARARWRSLAPNLAAEGLTPERLTVLAGRARRADAALEGMVDAWLADHPPGAFRQALLLRAIEWSAAPAELRLRLLARLIAQVAARRGDDPAPQRLDRLEKLADELDQAVASGRPLSRNLRGVLVRFDRSGALTFAPEPPRRPRSAAVRSS